ncbi:MAG: hypothetical protein OK474_08360 [Thaumarchaeota archaeon]|nr:hypothetical protein [Nitrososphaerota archaeon]
MFDAFMQSHGVNMPAFHSAFTSLPMGKPELSLYEEALDLSLADMRKLGEI